MDANFELLKITLWYKSLIALLVFSCIRYLYRTSILTMLRRLTAATAFKYDEEILAAFEKPINVMLWIGGLYTAIALAPIYNANWAAFDDRVLRSSFAICFFWGMYNLSSTTHLFMTNLLNKAGIRSEDAVSNLFATITRILIVLMAFVTVAKEWNYDISAFIASLGIGSLAVALAAKDALANVFGSLIIILDKPFVTGDWISANGQEGVVEKVTFRSTCIRTFPNELVYIPNSLLSNAPITNFTRRHKRRINFAIGLTYNTTSTQMEEFIQRVRTYLGQQQDLEQEGIRVHFQNYGGSSLDVQITCYALTNVAMEYLDIVQRINLEIMHIMEEVGVSCAFPSTSVYFENPLQQEQVQPFPLQEEAAPAKPSSRV